MLDWDALRVFLAAAREGSLAGAARVLTVKHTTVGRRLDELEETLGAKVFRRTPEGLALTDVGQAILPMAEEMERTAQRLSDAAAGDAHLSGVVRVSLSEAFTAFVVKRLGALRVMHPELVVEVLTSNQAADLARGEADIAMRLKPLEDGDLVCKHLGSFGWSVYAADAYVARSGRPDLACLAGHDVVGYDAALAGSPGGVWIDAHAAGARVVLRGNSIIAALNAAIAGLGIACVPCFLGGAEPSLVRLTADVVGSREAFLLVHPDRQKVPRVRAVFDFLAAMLMENAALLHG